MPDEQINLNHSPVGIVGDHAHVAGDIYINQAAAAIATSLHQLPPPPADFTGRAAELSQLHAAIAQSGVAISGLRGMGGVGKTALALKLAAQLTSRYPDAQFYLNLRGCSPQPLSPAEAMAHVIRAYRPDVRLPQEQSELASLYRSLLHGQRALLLLDDAADAAQVEPLLPPPSCLLLVTSRRRFVLPGLRPLDLDALTEEDAHALLLSITPRIGDWADEMAALCGRLPLALRLAGSAIAERIDLSPAAYLERLRDAQPRLGLVESSLSLSYDLLDPDLQRFWRLLFPFPATFDAAATAAVWELEVFPAQDRLSELVRYSLVEWNTETARYSLHDLARLYAESRLRADERAAASYRYAAYYETVLRSANRLYKQGGESVARGLALFDLEWTNIQAGWGWAAARIQEDERAARLGSAYPDAGAYCLTLRQHPGEQIVWLETAVTAARLLKNRRNEGMHLGNLGNAYYSLGQVERAIEYYEQALEIAREIGDRRAEGVSLGNLGIAYADLGQVERAIEYHNQAMAISREIGNRRGEGADLGNLGLAYADRGQVERAIAYHTQALEIAREIGDRRAEGNHLGNLGLAYADLGQVERAIKYYTQSLAIAHKIGDRRGKGNWSSGLGLAYAALGQVERAIEYYEQALEIAREIGDRRAEGRHLGNLGSAYAALGQVERAIAHYEQAMTIRREIGDIDGVATDSFNMARLYAQQGKTSRALELAQEAARIFDQIGSPYAQRAQQLVAQLHGRQGKTKRK